MDDRLEENLDALSSAAFVVWCVIVMGFVLISIATLFLPPFLFSFTR